MLTYNVNEQPFSKVDQFWQDLEDWGDEGSLALIKSTIIIENCLEVRVLCLRPYHELNIVSIQRA